MKHLYRVGLGHRYGKVMQVIAGVHFNYSVPPALWPVMMALEGHADERAARDAGYMGLIRNLQRWVWLVVYLFGVSPAVCKSFFAGKGTNLPRFDETTLYEPFATSLRMGDIGYQNRREEGLGVKANYDDLPAYIASLTKAITTPASAWEEIGVKVDGEYRQLNANLLQIENEYYSTIRPKTPLEWLEKPVSGLARDGIRYVELRALDIDPYDPLGIDHDALLFLEVMMLACLLAPSPRISAEERGMIDYNLLTVAHQGRSPGIQLRTAEGGRPLRIWGLDLLAVMRPIAALLDGEGSHAYQQALARQRDKLMEPELTPSARALREMRDNGEGFYAWANRLSQQHRRTLREYSLSPGHRAELVALAEESHRRQREIEAADAEDFDSFLTAQAKV
jgi:glutamate--cysteine ligase